MIQTKRLYLNLNMFNIKLTHDQNPDQEDLNEFNFNFRANEVLKIINTAFTNFFPGD